MTTSLTGRPLTARPTRSSFVTSDLETAERHYDAVYRTSLRMSGIRPGSTVRHGRIDASSLLVDHVGLPEGVRFDADPLNALTVAEMRSGWFDHRSGGLENRVGGPGDLCVVGQPDLPLSGFVHSVDYFTMTVPMDAVLDAATTAPDRRPHRVRFTTFAPRSPEAARLWRQTLRGLLTSVLRDDAETSPLVLGAATRLMAAVSLETFAHDLPDSGSPCDRRDATPATLRHAVDFVERNAADDIGVADIARAAFVTTRAVQLAFRRHLDCTPLEYLRRVRLQRAHDELRAAAPDSVTVAATAVRWGFSNPSRFTTQYRSMFGESPVQTLHGS